MECVTISQTVKRKDFEVGNILWTKVQAFQDPNAHEVRGVVKLEKDSWKMCLALISNPANRELAWPAQLRWKLLFVVESRKTEEIEQRDAKDWNEEDIGKIFWADCIEVPHMKLEKYKLVDSDSPITFMWFVELAVAFSPLTTRETREAISECSTEENVDTTDDERDSQEDESQGAGASQLKSITQGGADGKRSMPSASAKIKQKAQDESKGQTSKFKGLIGRLEQDNRLKDNIIKKLKNDLEQKDKTHRTKTSKLQAEIEQLRTENAQISQRQADLGEDSYLSDDSGMFEGEGEIEEMETAPRANVQADEQKHLDRSKTDLQTAPRDNVQADEQKHLDRSKSDLHSRWNDCQKNPGHEQFIPVVNVNLHHLPEGYRDQLCLDYIMAVINLTVRLVVSYVTKKRPGKRYPWSKIRTHYPVSQYRGQYKRSFGSGRVIKTFKSYRDVSDKPCPCPKCQKLPKREQKAQWAEFLIATARYVVFDEEEARHTQADIDFNEDTDRDTCPKLHGLSVRYCNTDEDLCLMSCVTHDRDVALMLEERVRRYDDLRTQLENKYSNLRATDTKSVVIVSHPHGMSKHISVGEWIHQQEEKPYKWRYTTATCPGSAGAPVCVLGNLQGKYISVSTHCGYNRDFGLNESGSDGLFL